MALLNPAHWETITPQLHEILSAVGQASFSNRFYLAGGTALALILGHRRSVDLDFFSERDEVMERNRREITRYLAKDTSQIIENTYGNLVLEINNTRVGFFGYGYPLIKSGIELEGINIASLEDIGLMKLDAIIRRGARKDFYELFFISQVFSIDDLLELGKIKYPMVRDFAMMALEHLVLFDSADRDYQPDLLVDQPWDAVKQYFLPQASILAKKWFE